MKKIVVCLSVVAMMGLMASCSEKEGVYKPKEQIEHVYQSSTSTMEVFNEETGAWEDRGSSSEDKALAETWSWKDGKLQQITFHDRSGAKEDQTFSFNYDGNRVKSIDGNNLQLNFFYDGKKIQKIELVQKQVNPYAPFAVYTFTHDGKKITRMEVQMRRSKGVGYESMLMEQLIGRMLLTEGVNVQVKHAEGVNEGTKDPYETQTYDFTWEGKNISKMVYSGEYGKEETTFTYDKKNNPYFGLFMSLSGQFNNELGDFANRNNVTKAVSTYIPTSGDKTTEETNYSYTYKGDWPESRTGVTIVSLEDYRYNYSETLYFEYSK